METLEGALTFSIATSPQNDTLTGTGVNRIYTPITGFSGTDTGDGASIPLISAPATVSITVVNNPPVLSLIGNKTVDEGTPLSFSATASDIDGDVVTFSASNLPPGATFIGATFSWTPSEIQGPGTFSGIVITATDSEGLSDLETLTITVNVMEQA